MASKKTTKSSCDMLRKIQSTLALQDVNSFVRQYVAIRTSHGDYARTGIVLSEVEQKQIADFAEMLTSLVNDCK